MTGVKIVAQDANGNVVPDFGNPQFTVDQPNSVSISNVQVTSDLPANSTFTFDIQSGVPSNGPVNITIQGQQGNFQPTFETVVQISVVLDPSTPGPPTQWAVTAGAVVSK